MGDGSSGDVTQAELRELAGLRPRAYGPSADIDGDASALARLIELEDRLIRARYPAGSDSGAEPHAGAEPDAGAGSVADPDSLRFHTTRSREPELQRLDPERAAGTGESPGAAPSARRAPRSPATSAAAVVGLALVAGAVLWGTVHARPTADDAATEVEIEAGLGAARVPQDRAREYVGYLDGLRDDVLSLPGSTEVAARMIYDQLRPYGTLYGRTVGAGPTTDHEFCMIIADQPAASITCISVENAYANPASVVLPSRHIDSESDEFVGIGDLVSYTLMPGGGVVAVPAEG